MLIASIVYNTTNAIKFLGGKTKQWPSGLPSITLNMNAAKGFLREALTARQMRIEVSRHHHTSTRASTAGGGGSELERTGRRRVGW